MVKYVRSRYFLLGLVFALSYGATAATVSYFGAGSSDQLGVSLATLISGEDQTNNVLRTEQQFSYKNVPHADTAVKSSAGFVHEVWCVGSDAAPTAGSIAFLDSTSAGAGTTILTVPITTTAWLYPQKMLPSDIVVGTGFYIDYTTTADVDCTVSYR